MSCVGVSSAKTVYTSCGCNKGGGGLDWSPAGLVAYASSSAVLLYDPQDGGGRVVDCLAGHSGRVNVVCWLRGPGALELLSGSSDGTAILWHGSPGTFKPQAVLKGHELAVNCVDGCRLSESRTMVVTGGADPFVLVWRRDSSSGEFEVESRLGLGRGLALSVKVILGPGWTEPLVALAKDDASVLLTRGEERLATLPGHEDWVTAIDYTTLGCGGLLIATGSQDTMVRLWRLSPHQVEPDTQDGLRLEEQVLELGGGALRLRLSLEAVLAGHEAWVLGLAFHPHNPHDPRGSGSGGGAWLASSSADGTVALWAPDAESSVWLETARLGDVGGLGALGFYTPRFSGDGGALLAHSVQSALHHWVFGERGWRSRGCAGGHGDGVVDLAWSQEWGALVSAGLDLTSRLHAAWTDGRWAEVSRPQVHGHALAALAWLPGLPAPALASAAEEKVIRVLTAPHHIATTLATIAGKPPPALDSSALPALPALPALGLSNKADQLDSNDLPDLTPLTEPPAEETLSRATLWAEVRKVYGHGSEVSAVAAAHAAPRLASAAKASAPHHAAIFLWDTRSWSEVSRLAGHQLTVTQLAFSPDDTWLASVSRDRTWRLYRRTPHSDNYEPWAWSGEEPDPVHRRILWALAWAPDSSVFGTGSRDGRAALWTPAAGAGARLGAPALTAPGSPAPSLTALAIARLGQGLLVALGTEPGAVLLYRASPTWLLIHTFSTSSSHQLTVKRLLFLDPLQDKDKEDEEGKGKVLTLASCSLDFSVKVHRITLTTS